MKNITTYCAILLSVSCGIASTVQASQDFGYSADAEKSTLESKAVYNKRTKQNRVKSHVAKNTPNINYSLANTERNNKRRQNSKHSHETGYASTNQMQLTSLTINHENRRGRKSHL